MKKRNLILAGLALPALGIAPLSAIAQERDLSYSYLQAEYINLDIDDYGDGNVIDDFDDGNGVGFRGSWALNDRWFLFGDYSSTESDVSFATGLGVTATAETDIKIFDVGAGYAMPLADNADAVFRGAYVDVDVDDFSVGGGGGLSNLDADSTDGFFLEAAWRGQVAPQWEVQAGARYTDIEDIDDFSVIASALFEIDDNWGIDLRGDFGDEFRTYSAGIRYSFD